MYDPVLEFRDFGDGSSGCSMSGMGGMGFGGDFGGVGDVNRASGDRCHYVPFLGLVTHPVQLNLTFGF